MAGLRSLALFLAKSADDLRLLTEVCVASSASLNDSALFKIGFVNPKEWATSESMCRRIPNADEQMVGNFNGF